MTEPNNLSTLSSPTHPDRWTGPKMALFLRELAATHSVAAAARSVGMSRQSAYRLRSRLKGKAFDIGWDVAFQHSYDNLAHAALERALNGVEVPVFYKGEQIASYRRYDERLTVALLSMSTQDGVPVLGRHAPVAEGHARRFEALLAEVAGGGGDPAAGPDLCASAEDTLLRLRASASPPGEAEEMPDLRGFSQRRSG